MVDTLVGWMLIGARKFKYSHFSGSFDEWWKRHFDKEVAGRALTHPR
jgi:hypothetical protein